MKEVKSGRPVPGGVFVTLMQKLIAIKTSL